MQIGIVHTTSSTTCGCAAAIARGVEALGWTSLILDCEDAVQDPGLLNECSVIFDHTDTFRGSGALRPFVRFVLASHGYCVVGSDAQVCIMCDHKIHAKDILTHAGIPVPNGFFYRGGAIDHPSDLRFPMIAKCGYEHMSRAMRVVDKKEELESILKAMYSEVSQPIIVEEMVGTRELEVGVIADGDGGTMVLPFMEWVPPEGRGAVFTYARKQVGGSTCVSAELPDDAADRLKKLALNAFHALNIRDYCRFDVRFKDDGSLYFLEANVIPNMEEDDGMARAALAAGIEYPALIERLVRSAIERMRRCGRVCEYE